MKPSRDIARLIEIMAALRTPGTGCPWDLEQNFATIAPYTLEEAYEVADAIERGDLDDLRDELGDLLLQVVFHARMARGARRFAFGDVVEAITEKLIRRHPHVFGDAEAKDAGRGQGAVGADQGRGKGRSAHARRGAAGKRAGALAGVPVALPALIRAQKLQAKASKVGFDWNDPQAVLAKIREEVDEIDEALARRRPAARRRRGRRPAVRHGQSCAPSGRRCRERVACDQPQIRAPLCAHRARSGATRRSRRRRPRSPKWTRCGTPPRRPRSDAAE